MKNNDYDFYLISAFDDKITTNINNAINHLINALPEGYYDISITKGEQSSQFTMNKTK